MIIPQEESLKLITREIAEKYQVVPVTICDRVLHIVTSIDLNPNQISELSFLAQLFIEYEVLESSIINNLINKYYPIKSPSIDDINLQGEMYYNKDDVLINPNEDAEKNNSKSVISQVDSIINQAVKMRASDIHFEPIEDKLTIRYRIDGVLQEMESLEKASQGQVISRLKVMAKLDIAEKRKPQDGRIRLSRGKSNIDIRVSTLPINYGEKVVLRLLDKETELLEIKHIGMVAEHQDILISEIEKKQGLILVTGPTGSGKTTTLYACLTHINNPSVNIVTVEDPIEYDLSGVNQSQIKPEIEYTFANALRAFLRQDPDVVMLGEIRDLETANIALRAALTGHLVLSTVHTNDCISTVTRLVNLGIPPYLVASSLSLIIAQRLVRKLCQYCKIVDDIVSSGEFQDFNFEKEIYTAGKGCEYCNHAGFQGRIGIFEVLEIRDELKSAISNGFNEVELLQIAQKNGLKSLKDNSIHLLENGMTSVIEITGIN